MPCRAITAPLQVSDIMTRLYKLVCIVDNLIDDSTVDRLILCSTAVTAADFAMSQCLLLS